MEINTELKQHNKTFTLGEFDITCLGGGWKATHLGEQTRYGLVERNEEIEILPNAQLVFQEMSVIYPLIVRDHGSGEMAIMNDSDLSYEMFSCLLPKAYPELDLPERAEVSIPVGLYETITELGLAAPWGKFERGADQVRAGCIGRRVG